MRKELPPRQDQSHTVIQQLMTIHIHSLQPKKYKNYRFLDIDIDYKFLRNLTLVRKGIVFKLESAYKNTREFQKLGYRRNYRNLAIEGTTAQLTTLNKLI